MTISRQQMPALAYVKTTCVSVELYVAGVKARVWFGCGDWNVETAQQIADEINVKATNFSSASIAAHEKIAKLQRDHETYGPEKIALQKQEGGVTWPEK